MHIQEVVAQKLAQTIQQLTADRTLLLTDAFERPWHSATFSGARHRLTFEATQVEEADLTTIVQAIPELQFSLPGQIVADAHALVRSDDARLWLEVELLTVVTC